MKVYYKGKEVGLPKRVKKMIDMFGDSIRISPKHVIACKCNNEVKSLDYKFKEGDTIDLIDLTDKDGMKVYIRGALFIVCKAFSELYPKEKLIINFQLKNAMFCQTLSGKKVTEEMMKKVNSRVHEIVKLDLPIEKVVMSKKEAKEFFDKQLEKDNLDWRGILQEQNPDKKEVSLYYCEDYYNYFFGVMPISTGYIDLIDCETYKNGFIIRYPNIENPSKIGEFVESEKFLQTLQEYDRTYDALGINTIVELNEKIKEGKEKEVIMASEALQEKKIAEIADQIAQKKGIKLILIAGPSSSSKTTFAKRLSTQLKVNGIKPVVIGTDDYFVEREQTPRDKNGDYNFETIDALDLDLFNNDLEKLIKGETAEIPTFDFKVGTKRYGLGKYLKLEDDEVLMIEGIHCLNDKLTSKIPSKNKFKIYISDLTVLNLDNYNRISTTDTRLVRRIVRDYNFRGYSALDTLQRWQSVNDGENENIFPYQEQADVMFNSSLVYEFSVLRKYAIPLLKKIDQSQEEYSEAKRIFTFLEYFTPIEDESLVPTNSLLREFIGGSIFDY